MLCVSYLCCATVKLVQRSWFLSEKHLTVSLITKNHDDNILAPVWLPTFYNTQLRKNCLRAPLLLKSSAVSTKTPTVWPCHLISRVHQVAKSVFYHKWEWHHVLCHNMKEIGCFWSTLLFSQKDRPPDHALTGCPSDFELPAASGLGDQ